MKLKSMILLVGVSTLLPSCGPLNSLVNPGSKRVKVVNEAGVPLAANIVPGTPAPFMGDYNFTNRQGYFWTNPNIGYEAVVSPGYQPFTAKTDAFPSVVVLKKARPKQRESESR